jgi:hypothetical protein
MFCLHDWAATEVQTPQRKPIDAAR